MLARNKDVPAEVWQEFVRQYYPGPSLFGRVIEVHPFGAFLWLDEGSEGSAGEGGVGIVGILHCSVWEHEPVPDERLRVRVTSVDEQRRLSLAPASTPTAPV